MMHVWLFISLAALMTILFRTVSVFVGGRLVAKQNNGIWRYMDYVVSAIYGGIIYEAAFFDPQTPKLSIIKSICLILTLVFAVYFRHALKAFWFCFLLFIATALLFLS